MKLAIYGNRPAFRSGSRPIPPIGTLQRAVDYKRNPVSRETMAGLLERVAGPGWKIADADTDLTDALIASAEALVLLWPDPNGFGWLSIERRVFRLKRAEATVHVLNGRGRWFALTPPMRRRFQLRRAAQRVWLVEGAFILTGVILAIPLTLYDLVRGRR
jgi:hypothetical protein